MFGALVGIGWEVGCHTDCFPRASLAWWSQGGQFITGNAGFLENVLKQKKWTGNRHLVIPTVFYHQNSHRAYVNSKRRNMASTSPWEDCLKKKIVIIFSYQSHWQALWVRSNSMHYFCFDARALFSFVFWETASCMLYRSTMQTYFKTFHVIP